MDRAYALLQVKSIDQDKRVITGVATTPAPDRMDDVVDPLGVRFRNPMPLLLHHDKERPVGLVKFFKPTAHGIEFEATLPTIPTPGVLKDRVDEAWDSLKAGLIKAVSIGFRVLQDGYEQLPSGGLKFLKTEVLELSLVTIPANQQATILTVKTADIPYLAATGLTPPGDSGTFRVVRARKDAPAMTTPEQITEFTSSRKLIADQMTAIMAKAASDQRGLDDDEASEYDDLKSKHKGFSEHIERLTEFQEMGIGAASATAITKADPTENSVQKAAAQRGGHHTHVSIKSPLPKGTAFTRMVMAKVQADGNPYQAAEIAKQWKDSTPEVEQFLRGFATQPFSLEMMYKTAVAAGSTTDSTWAAPLMPTYQALTSEFIDLLRPATIIGKLPRLRRVPFNVSVTTQTAGGTYNWVGQAKPKPLTSNAFAAVTLLFNKMAGIIVVTQELMKFSSPAAEEVVRNDMIKGIATFMDGQFIDPAVAASGTVIPASITNGTTPIVSSGTSPDNARTDIKALISTFVAANRSTIDAVIIMSEANAFALATAVNALGQKIYPDMTATGGSILGIPVVTSQTASTNVILVDQQGVLYADDGGVTIDVSKEASLQMDTAPDDPADGDTVMVSLFQNNLVALRAERFVTWKRAQTSAVKYVSGAAYV